MMTFFQQTGTQLLVVASLFVFMLVQLKVLPAIHQRWGMEVLEADGWKVRDFHRWYGFVSYGPGWPWWRSELLCCGTVTDDSDIPHEFTMSIAGPYFTWIRRDIVYNTRPMDDGAKGRRKTLMPHPREN